MSYRFMKRRLEEPFPVSRISPTEEEPQELITEMLQRLKSK